MLEESAGYENEAEGNAAYLDELIATGFQPYIFEGRDGHLIYGERMPERRQTDEENNRAIAVRWKYVRASTALKRVKDECLKRGMLA